MDKTIRLASLVVAGAMLTAATAAAQVTPPAGATTNTLTLEGTVTEVSPTNRSLSVKTTDGTTQLFRWVEKVFVHDGKPQADDELGQLHRGMAVVLHYSGTGKDSTVHEVDRLDGDGMKITEGRVTSIDRNREEIKVRLDNNTTETLRLTNRVARHVGRDLDKTPDTPVVVYYTDNKGVKEVHYFKKK